MLNLCEVLSHTVPLDEPGQMRGTNFNFANFKKKNLLFMFFIFLPKSRSVGKIALYWYSNQLEVLLSVLIMCPGLFIAISPLNPKP